MSQKCNSPPAAQVHRAVSELPAPEPGGGPGPGHGPGPPPLAGDETGWRVLDQGAGGSHTAGLTQAATQDRHTPLPGQHIAHQYYSEIFARFE